MSKFTDSQYLKNDQYRDSSNLDARVLIHQRYSTNPYGWFRWVFDHLVTLPENAKVLELGCGHGNLWKENVDRIPTGWQVTLSDLSPGMLDAAWRNLVITGRAFKFEEIDAGSIPYEEESFDAVIANHMLHHLPARPKALKEIKRILMPGGCLFATTVGERHMKEMNAWLSRVREDRHSVVFHLPFLLENGAEQLQQFFDMVKMDRYSDNLEVSAIEPIIAYIHSGFSSDDIVDSELAKLQLELELELEQKGKIFIAKDSGLFTAVKEE